MRRSILTASLLLMFGAADAATQGAPDVYGPEAPPERSRVTGTLTLLNTQPMGNLSTGPGIGAGLSAAWALDPAHLFRIRGEFRGALYGSESRRACLSETVGCLIEVDINTSYSTLYLGAGPELALPLGPAELVLDATAGLASFTVSSSVRGISDSESTLDTNNFSDNFFAWSAGGELRIPVARQVSVALGAHYQRNGDASYVNEGGITVNPDGSLDIDARTTDANFMAITLGVAFRPFVGWTKDDDDDDERDHERY